MENTQKKKVGGLNSVGLRIWGFLFVMFGIAGRGILQNNLLNLGNLSTQQLLDAMEESQTVMLYATMSLGLQALETCAIPIFAFLLVEGVRHTSNFGEYFVRVSVVAVLSEIPFNLAMSGTWLDWSARNPVFGLVFALMALYFFKKFEEKKVSYLLIKIIVAAAALLWCRILSIDFGMSTVFIVIVLWIFRKNSITQHLAGAVAALICGVFSMFFITAPMSFLAIHLYNGEKGKDSRAVNYLMYPAILLIMGIVGLCL